MVVGVFVFSRNQLTNVTIGANVLLRFNILGSLSGFENAYNGMAGTYTRSNVQSSNWTRRQDFGVTIFDRQTANKPPVFPLYGPLSKQKGAKFRIATPTTFVLYIGLIINYNTKRGKYANINTTFPSRA